MKKSKPLWRKSAAPVAAALIGLGAFNVQALSLGKVKVQSALGQSLVAEIDIADLSEEDSKSLKSALASPSAFVGMGLEYNPALSGTQIALQRRPDGNRFLKLVSTKPLNDPFVDLVVELSWGSGRIVRTYTILLDPPKTLDIARPAVPPTLPTEAAASSPVPAPAAAATPQAVNSASTTTPPPTSLGAQTVASAKAQPATANPSSAPAVVGSDRRRIRVGKGDTAGKLARSMASQGVTVDQILVALLNANPGAFMAGNVNLLKAGAELSIPDLEAASKTSPAQAREILETQYQAFQTMRRGLASQAPLASSPTAQKEASGTSAKPPSAAVPAPAQTDTLKLSKESVQSKAEKDGVEQIAKQRAKTDATERAAELARNIDELNKLAQVAAKPVPAESPAAAVSAATGQAVTASTTNEGASASTAAPALPVAPPVVPLATPKNPEQSTAAPLDLVDTALENPGFLAGLIAILGLGAFGIYRRVQGSKSRLGKSSKERVSQWETSANTNFDIGAGQRVDTADAQTAGLATMVFPESQLEMVNELDPVAEAEVYLAYGKDVPAEEILKEGLQQDPTRVAIHLKLLGIYAKRQDTVSFEAVAKEVWPLVDSTSAEWAQVQEMGKSIDPSNPLYGQPAAAASPGESSDEVTGVEPTMLSFDIPASTGALSDAAGPAASAARPSAQAGLNLSNGSQSSPKAVPKAASAQEFDLMSISLNPPIAALPATPQQDAERLDATLALAEQFIAIDEKEGARALLEEVIAGGNDALRQRAKALLARVQ